MTAKVLPGDLVRYVSLLLEDLDTPRSLALAINLRYGEWGWISSVETDPRLYLDAQSYARDAAASAFLKKLAELPSGVDKRAAAVEKWRQGERDCYWANERLCRYLPENRLFDDRCDTISSFLDDVRKIILSWIGYGPNDESIGRFGPGATYSDRGWKTTIPDKINSDPVLTRDAIWYLPQWLGTQWGAVHARRHGNFVFVPGNRYTTVPKTSRTDRSIASEPSINVFYQLALGRELRSRLRSRAGWDLDRAQEVHRQVAEASSVTREYATLDLSNASDTVCKNLVKILLPPRWFSALDDLRSKKTLIGGKWVMLEKFSSMGNGFTFELETLLFAAISCVVSRQVGHIGELAADVFVFGDDIIVKNDVSRPLKSVLEFLGFSLNAAKSYFSDEPFRESCGGDYYSGKPVRPYYLKELPNGPQGYIALANGLSALFGRLALTGFACRRRAWFSVLDQLPSRVRDCRGPQVLGDLVIHDQEEHWTFRYRHSIRYLRAFRPSRYRIRSFEEFAPEVVLACATYGTGNRRGGVIPRDGVLGYKVGWVPYS